MSKRVISLTSIPSRFPKIGETLESLVAQGSVADSVELYIPHSYRRFPDFDGVLPKVPAGVTIERVQDDLGPGSKVLFAANKYRGDDVQLLFCDDDRKYPDGWAKTLFDAQSQRPSEAVALSGWEIERTNLIETQPKRQPRYVLRDRKWDWDYRWKRVQQQWTLRTLRATRRKPPRRLIAGSGYADVFEGFGGVVVRPEFFDEVAYDIPPVVWTVDDVWLSGMLARKMIPIWLVADMYSPRTTDADDADALWRSVIDGADNPQANAQCAALLKERFGIWS